MEELEQQPRKELTFLWEGREFKTLHERSTAAALLVTWLSQKIPKNPKKTTNKSQNQKDCKTLGDKEQIFLPGPAANRDKLFVSQKF